MLGVPVILVWAYFTCYRFAMRKWNENINFKSKTIINWARSILNPWFKLDDLTTITEWDSSVMELYNVRWAYDKIQRESLTQFMKSFLNADISGITKEGHSCHCVQCMLFSALGALASKIMTHFDTALFIDDNEEVGLGTKIDKIVWTSRLVGSSNLIAWTRPSCE